MGDKVELRTSVNIEPFSRSRRQFLMLGAGFGAASFARAVGGGGFAHQRKKFPNIVLIFLDDQGWNDAGCYGNPLVKTPHTDRLAQEGVRFTRAYVTSPSCSASRASLLTGRYPHSNGVISLIQWHVEVLKQHFPGWNKDWEERTYEHSLKHSEIILPQQLKELGYATALRGKWHVSVEPPTAWGFDEVDTEPRDFFARSKSNPFFFYYAPEHTHRRFRTSPDFQYDPNEVVLPPYLNDDPELREDLASYYSAISNQDREIGKIMDALDKNNLAENTIVVLSSDNGPPYAKAKMTLYDWGVHTLLIVRYPARLPAANVVNALASTVDIYPTLLELMGEPVPERLQGESLVDVMENPQAVGRNEVFCETNYHVFYNPMRCIIADRWKYIRSFRPEMPHYIPDGCPPELQEFLSKDIVGLEHLKTPLPVPPRPEEELFDVKQDPLENRNLAAVPEHRETLTLMREQLGRWMRDTNDNLAEKEKHP